MEDRSARFGVDPFRGQPLQIWQGTILEGGSNGLLSRKLVISADCDLTDAKGNREFFSLDIVRAEDLARELIGGDARSELLATLIQSARETATNRAAGFEHVSDQAMLDWLTQSTPERWARDLPALHSNERDWLASIRSCALNLLATQDKANPSSVLVCCENKQLAKQLDQLNKKVKRVLQARLDPSRVDLYILPPFPGESGTAGHVVPFKTLSLMSLEQVCMRRVDLADVPHGFVPRATCRPVLLQSLLQKLTTYFARIGLTNSFKSEQESVVKALLESLQ